MLKEILKLSNAKILGKDEQKNTNGGLLKPNPGYTPCTICATAPAGTWCGPSHCPGICDGNGGVNRI